MFRSVVVRYVAPVGIRSVAARKTLVTPVSCMATRFYSPPSNLGREAISGRVIDVIKTFNKTGNTAEVTATSSFQKDLGLDSLDTVELIVAIEEEFSIEIPDKVADDLKTVAQTVDYIKSETDAS